MSRYLYLGIEGGATRTTGVLVDAHLQAVARRVAGPANVHAAGEDGAGGACAEIVAALLAEAGACWDDVTAAALCLSGLRLPADYKLWRRLVTEMGIGCPVHLTHDAAAGLAAGSPDGTGILVISGTGSLVYGRRADGCECTAGGRGPLLGDEGSGFDIGHQALRAAARSVDGRGEPTVLERLIPRRLGVESFEELLTWASPFAKDRVASVAPIVFEAARSGDTVAQAIADGAVGELARGVEAVSRRLWPGGGPPRVVCSGGVLQHQEGFLKALAERVRAFAPEARCTLPDVEGAVGAARVARQWHEQRP